MVTYSSNSKDYLRRVAEASAWRIALFDSGAESSEEFENWLADDPANAQAWSEVQRSWEQFDLRATTPELMEVRRKSLEYAQRHQRRRPGWRSIMVGGARPIAAATILVVCMGGGAQAWWVTHSPVVYQTAVGERRTFTLADGTRVDMDSGSELRVSLRKRERDLHLIKGQARFNVAHDAARPFMVAARDQTVIATGTSFNVDLLGPTVVVTLIEGKVSIVRGGYKWWPVVDRKPRVSVVAKLNSGEKLVTEVDPKGVAQSIEKVSLADIRKELAWERGQLIFNNEDLGSVTETMSRYSDHPILADGAAASFKVSGVFDTDHVSTFVDTVQRVLPVWAQTDEDGSIHLRSKS